jgi:hypothetical protein
MRAAKATAKCPAFCQEPRRQRHQFATREAHLQPLHESSYSAIQHQSASLAQLVERGTSNAEVTGSTPLGGINLLLFFTLCQTCTLLF